MATPSPKKDCLTCIDALHLLSSGETMERTAERLDMKAHSLERHLTRHGHPLNSIIALKERRAS